MIDDAINKSNFFITFVAIAKYLQKSHLFKEIISVPSQIPILLVWKGALKNLITHNSILPLSCHKHFQVMRNETLELLAPLIYKDQIFSIDYASV